jgi:hypothetical protein
MMTTPKANHYWYRYVSAKVRAINLKSDRSINARGPSDKLRTHEG